MLKCFVTLLISVSFISLFHVIVSSNEIESSCLNIICKVSTNCDVDRKCLGTGHGHCGPFQISHSYWKDSGSPGDSFHSCAFNTSCSMTAVAAYMQRFGRDCNKDNIIDCADYAAIHKAGPRHCDDHWVPKTAFMQSFFALSGRDAEASESVRSRIAYDESFRADLRDFRRVASRNRPTPVPRRRNILVPLDPVRDIVSAVGPWVVDAVSGSRRGSRRPGNEVQPPRRRRIRPQVRPNALPTTSQPTTPPAARPTRPQNAASPTRRRFRPVDTSGSAPVTRATIRPDSRPATPPEAPTTIPWWRLATASPFPDHETPLMTTRRIASTTEAARITTSTTVADITRRVTPRLTALTVVPTTPSPATSLRPATIPPERNPATTRKPTLKPTFNPNRSNSTSPSLNDVEPQQDGPAKANRTAKEIPLSTTCLECICIGSSGCNFDADLKCYGEEECGPYRIDYAYWYEAGFPGYKGAEDDFARCAKNRTCAEKAVHTYIRSNARDCNHDGVIDCLDYASIHKAGPDACNTDWMYDSKYWAAFTTCYGFDEKEMNRRRRSAS